MMDVIPALSSAPSNVLPSVTIKRLPLNSFIHGKRSMDNVTSLFKAISLPSKFSMIRGLTPVPLKSGAVSMCAIKPTVSTFLSKFDGSFAYT